MEKTEFIGAFAELMAAYTEKRAAWVVAFGSDSGFDGWFTAQVLR